MTKTVKNTLKCIAVITIVSFIAVGLVMLVSALIPSYVPTINETLAKKLLKSDTITVYDTAQIDEKFSTDVAAFNDKYGNAAIKYAVYGTGGAGDGKYLVVSTGEGYGKGNIEVYTAYGKDKKIEAVEVSFVDTKNDRWKSKLSSYIDQIYADLIGKSGSVGEGKDLVGGVSTEATSSLNGIARAVNIANEFVVGLYDGFEENKDPQPVTDAALLAKLREITSAELTFNKYFFEASAVMTEGSANTEGKILAAYVSSAADIILESRSSYKEYGGHTLLVKVDSNTKKAISVNFRSVSAENYGNIVSEVLANKERLTAVFAGKDKDQVKAMDQNSFNDGFSGSQITTGATETRTGLQICVYAALDRIDAFVEEWGDHFLPKDVEAGTKLDKLRETVSGGDTLTFKQYPFSVSRQINAVYVSGSGHIIFETTESFGEYGGNTLLVGINKDTKLVTYVNWLSMNCENYSGVVSEVLKDRARLTAIFAGKGLDDITTEKMPNSAFNPGGSFTATTGATETRTGLINSVRKALTHFDSFMSAWGSFIGG